ncbi:hypothetical protein SUGI_0788760 [Cryptomeria japonica]|nr:hypothetical protein SUGI_0788760 [Cryptomeria japonica]
MLSLSSRILPTNYIPQLSDVGIALLYRSPATLKHITKCKGSGTKNIVDYYAGDELLFMKQFAQSMVKMGNIKPRTGSHGEIRKDYNFIFLLSADQCSGVDSLEIH